MKRSIKLLLLLGGLMSVCLTPLFGQTPTGAFDEISSDPSKANGVMRVCEFPATTHLRTPAGYELFYVSHYGRHGARWATSENSYRFIADLLDKAAEAGKLTPLGERLHVSYRAVYPQLIGHVGELTEKGAAQHREIAADLAQSAQSLLKRGGHVEAESSIVPRCIMSMNAFCAELQRQAPRVTIHQKATPGSMRYLSPCDPTNEELLPVDRMQIGKAGPWHIGQMKYAQEIIDPEPILARLFTDMRWTEQQADAGKIARSLFSVYSGREALDFPMGEDFDALFTADELARLWEITNISFYMMEGQGLPGNGRLYRYAGSLLQDIVDRVAEDWASGCTLRLRFGHDMTLMGLMALMGIDTWGEQVQQVSQIKDTWRTYRVPMASNLQFRFYRKRNTDTAPLVRILYNGEPVTLTGLEKIGEYDYRWSDFESWCRQRLADAKLDPDAPVCLWMYDLPDRFEHRPMQAMAIHGGVLFVCYDRGYCRTFRFRTGEPFGEFKMGCFGKTNHCGNANFGIEYPAGNKEHPALYISGDLTERACYVQSITRRGSKTVQTIRFDLNPDFGGSQAVIDTARRRIVYMQRRYKEIGRADNQFVMTEFRLPALGEGDITFTAADALDTYVLPSYLPIYQGASIIDGKLVQTYGFPGKKIGVAVLDLTSHEWIEQIDLTQTIPFEPQSIALYKGKIYMNYSQSGLYVLANTPLDQLIQ